MKSLIKISLTTLFVIAIFGLAPILAQDLSQISFPVAELGNCASVEECKTYCDSPDHFDACLDFASQKKIMSEEEVQTAKKLGAEFDGPGGCSTHEECRLYCDQPGHSQECMEFAVEHDIIPPDEQAEVEQVLNHLQAGGSTPGDCSSKTSCEAYCDSPDHIDECTEFALATGLMSAEEAEMMRKTGGAGPGGCQGREECDGYCDNPDNFEACIAFAVEHGMMSAEEAEKIKKMGPEMREGPGGCQEREECDAYCENPNNMEECIDFGLKHGMITPEEAEMAKKMGSRVDGPGGCESREECDAYCENPSNTEECIKFSVEHGFMTEEDAQKMKEGPRIPEGAETPGGCRDQECEIYCQDPEHQEECHDFAVKYKLIDPEKEKMMHEPGPGGCFGKECHNYCDDPENFDECHEFAEGQGVEVRLPPKVIEHKQEEWTEEHPGEAPPPPEYFKQQAGEFPPEELERKKQEWMEEHPGEVPPPMQEFKKIDEGMSPEEWNEERQKWLQDRPGEAFEKHSNDFQPPMEPFNEPPPNLSPKEWENKKQEWDEEYSEEPMPNSEYYEPKVEDRRRFYPEPTELHPEEYIPDGAEAIEDIPADYIFHPEGEDKKEPEEFQDYPVSTPPTTTIPAPIEYKEPGEDTIHEYYEDKTFETPPVEPAHHEPPKMNTDEPMYYPETGSNTGPMPEPTSGGGGGTAAPTTPASVPGGGGGGSATPAPPPPVEVKGESITIESPGGCLGTKECLIYCASPKHWAECWEWRYFN